MIDDDDDKEQEQQEERGYKKESEENTKATNQRAISLVQFSNIIHFVVVHQQNSFIRCQPQLFSLSTETHFLLEKRQMCRSIIINMTGESRLSESESSLYSTKYRLNCLAASEWIDVCFISKYVHEMIHSCFELPRRV